MAHVARFVSAAYPNTGAQVPTVPGVELGHVLPTRHIPLRISAQSAAQLTRGRAEGGIRVSAAASNCTTGRDARRAWMMARGKDTIPIGVAAKDFATGGVNYKARAIDTDHDGTISKDEFVAYAGKKFDSMNKTDIMVSVTDMAKAISRGNTNPDEISGES